MDRFSQIQGLEEQINAIREQLADTQKKSARGRWLFSGSLIASIAISYGISYFAFSHPGDIHTSAFIGSVSYFIMMYAGVYCPWQDDFGVYIHYLQNNLQAYQQELRSLLPPTLN